MVGQEEGLVLLPSRVGHLAPHQVHVPESKECYKLVYFVIWKSFHLWWSLRRLVALLKSPGWTVTTDIWNLASSSLRTCHWLIFYIQKLLIVRRNEGRCLLRQKVLSPAHLWEAGQGVLGGCVHAEAGAGQSAGHGGHVNQPRPGAALQQRQTGLDK